MKRILKFIGCLALFAFAGTGAYGAEQTLTVNQAWAGTAKGTVIEGYGAFGTTAFDKIMDAVQAADISEGAVTINVMAGTYDETVTFNFYHDGGKKNWEKVKFTDEGKDWYGRIHFVAVGEVIMKQVFSFDDVMQANFADIHIDGFTFNVNDMSQRIPIAVVCTWGTSGTSKDIVIKNNKINYLNPAVGAATLGPIYFAGYNLKDSTVEGNIITGATKIGMDIGVAVGSLDNVKVEGNILTDSSCIGIYGQVLEGGVTVSGNKFDGCDWAIYANNGKAVSTGAITVSGNEIVNGIDVVICFTGKAKKADFVIGEGNKVGGVGVTGWAEVANNAVVIDPNASAKCAVYYDKKLYLGDETAFKTPTAAVAGRTEPVTILNYAPSMQPPKDWKFVTEGGVTKLVKKVYVAKIGDDGYETLQEALDAAVDNDLITLVASATEGHLRYNNGSGNPNPKAHIAINLNEKTLKLDSFYASYATAEGTYAVISNGWIDITDAQCGPPNGEQWPKSVFFAQGNNSLTFEDVHFTGSPKAENNAVFNLNTSGDNTECVFKGCDFALGSINIFAEGHYGRYVFRDTTVDLAGTTITGGVFKNDTAPEWATTDRLNVKFDNSTLKLNGAKYSFFYTSVSLDNGARVELKDVKNNGMNCGDLVLSNGSKFILDGCAVHGFTNGKLVVNEGCELDVRNAGAIGVNCFGESLFAKDSKVSVSNSCCTYTDYLGKHIDLRVDTNHDLTIEDGADVDIANEVRLMAGATIRIADGRYGAVLPNAEGVVCTGDLTGGIYKVKPADAFVNRKARAVDNDDEATKDEYPYMVYRLPDVAQVGEEKFVTIEDAYAAVPDGGTIKLLADAVWSGTIINTLKSGAGRNFTIDLDGKKLTIDGALYTNYNVTFKDGEVFVSNPTGAVMGEHSWNKLIYVEFNSRVGAVQLLFDNVKFTCEKADIPALIQTSTKQVTVKFNKSELYLSNCAKPVYLSALATALFVDTKIVANGVTNRLIPCDDGREVITLTGCKLEMVDCDGFASNCNNVTIEDSDVSATGLAGYFLGYGAMTLKNGAKVVLGDSSIKTEVIKNAGFVVEEGSEFTISGMPATALLLTKASSVAAGADVSIDSPITTSAALQIAAGAYKSVNVSGSGSISLTGGIYDVEPEDAFIAPCYRKTKLTEYDPVKWLVELDSDQCPAKIVHEDGSVSYYATFAEAVDAADDKGTVSVNREIAVGENVVIENKDVTLDLAGQVINSNISFGGTAEEEFIIDSVGGGKVFGEIFVDDGCTLKIRAGLYKNSPRAWVDPAVDATTGMPLYIVVQQDDGLFKVMENQVEPQETPATKTTVLDENGNVVPPENMDQDDVKALDDATEELVNSLSQNSGYDGGLGNVAKNADGTLKNSTVDNLRANAPAGTADQITSDSKVSEKFLIELSERVATVKPVATAGGTVKKAVYTTLIYDVKPIVKTTVINADGEEVIAKAQLSNEEVKKNPVTFRLAIVDPMATGAYVRHIGHDEFADETRFCKVQGAAGERYVEIKDVDHFSLFEVRTTTAVVTETEDAVTILNLGVPAAGSELAAAVPFTKSGVTVDTPAKLADLVITGRANGDKIVFQNEESSSTLEGDVWSDDDEQTIGTPFWYQSAGSTIPLTLAGFMPNSASTPIASGTVTEPAATLLVNPFNSEQDIFTALTGAQDGDQIALVGGNERYVRKDGVWGFYSKSANMTQPGDVYVDNDFTPVSSLAVPGGKGVWYISKGGAPAVAWSAAGAVSEAEQIADATIPTYGSIAWGVSLDVEKKAAFNPEFARLVVYNGDEELGGYTRQLADGQLESAWTVFLGADGWTWSNVQNAKFAVALLDAERNLIVSSEKTEITCLDMDAFAWNYAGSKEPTAALTVLTDWEFSVTDDGEFESLKTTFAGAGVVTKTATGYLVTLTNNMDGVVTLEGGLGNVTLNLNGHDITGADGTLTNPVGEGGNAIEIAGNGPGANPTVLTVMNGDPSKRAQIAGGKGASSATGFNGGTAIFVDPALADVRVNVAGPNAQSVDPLVQGGNAGIGYVSTTGAAGLAITAANVGEVGEGMIAAGKPGELHKAWAWCTGTVPHIEGNGFETDSTGTNWFFRTAENGGASFDFKEIAGWTGDGVIHFVAGPIDVDGLRDTGFGGALTFVGEGADETKTTLKAISEASVFAVTGVTTKRTWKKLAFTDGASVAADKADGGAISMTGGSLSIEGCTFENCVGGEFGGAVYAALLTGDSTVTNSTFTGNAPLAEGDGYYNENALGGAIYVTAAAEGVTFAVADSVFEGNEAYSGGAIYAETKAADGEKPVALSILRVTFSGNRAEGFDGNGGAIVAEGDVTVDEGNVTVHEVDGLVYAGEPTVFTNNTATSNGGAIEMTGRQQGEYVPTVKICRGVVFADNKVVNGVDMVLGGAFANWIPCRFEATGVEFRGNTATCASKSEGYGTSLALGGALAFTADAKAVLVDTCVFNGNDVFVEENDWRYGGAIGMVNVPSAILKNSTFRNSTAEALALLGSTVGVTNCVIVGNGAGLGADGGALDVWIEQSTVDIAYSAYGNVEDLEAGSLTWLEHGNLAGCVPDKVYAGETLRLNENGFNPVAALGITQDAYDFVGVKYGSKNVELGGSSMGAYETGFTPLVVTLTGDKTYDGHTTSNGCAWTWKLTDTNGVAQTWDELGNVDEAFTIVKWKFGKKDHGYYASTNDTPMTVDATLAGAEDLRFALRFRYDGTISRRDVELGGLLVETTPDEYAYTGDEVKAVVKVTDTNANDEVLVLGTDYILRYENNVNPTDGALAIVEGINNYEGVVSTNYFITAYYVEYSFDGVVDDSLTEIHGAKSADVVEALPYAEKPEGYAFDKFHSPTNGVVYRYGDGTPAQLVLEVKYCTDANGDTVPDKYQKQIRAKVVNGEWNGENNGRDKILWVTLTEDGEPDGVWSTAGKGKLPADKIPAAGANADGGYTGNKDNKWLTLQGGQLVYLTAQQMQDLYITSGSVPFFLYAYLKGNPGSSLGFGFGRPGSGSTGTPDVAGRFSAYVTASSLTMNPAKKLATISVKANLVEAESGAPVMDIPLEGSKVTVKAMETLGGPTEDLEVPVDGDNTVTVPAEGDSGYWQIGL